MNENERRELEKVRDAVRWMRRHLFHETQMNMALHMTDTPRPAPLAATVDRALLTLDQLLDAIKEEK